MVSKPPSKNLINRSWKQDYRLFQKKGSANSLRKDGLPNMILNMMIIL